MKCWHLLQALAGLECDPLLYTKGPGSCSKRMTTSVRLSPQREPNYEMTASTPRPIFPQALPLIKATKPWCSWESCSAFSLRSSSLSYGWISAALHHVSRSMGSICLQHAFDCRFCAAAELTLQQGDRLVGLAYNRAGGTTWNSLDEVVQHCAGEKEIENRREHCCKQRLSFDLTTWETLKHFPPQKHLGKTESLKV